MAKSATEKMRTYRQKLRQRGMRLVQLWVPDPAAPGYAEAMRAESRKFTPLGILTRGVSGIAGGTLIVNFPGNPKAIGELFPVIAPTLGHAVATLQRESGRGRHGHGEHHHH